ncbi:hypothetical protein EMPS_09768 [Entomortierella parvispora]|uniref:Galactose oxidase n=1 Tax=Entomortierella parvispora TaxID=205924 RepID=A0A9P3M0K7_9FUNG|nr:hypothetical protein EMPS_09768 [Entomortierella parvispora]
MISLFLLFCLLDLVIFSPTQAQNATVVTAVSSPAFARFGSKLYVVGGGYEREVKTPSSYFYNSPTFIMGDGQFIVLDLSVSWKGSAPAWRKLQSGPKQYGFPGAMSADGNKMVTFHSSDDPSAPFAMVYDVPTDTWTPSKVQVPLGNRTGVGAVLNPLNNQVYLPSGYEDTLGDQLYMYNFATDTMNKTSMAGALTGALYYSGVWNSNTKTMLFFGGRVYPSGSYAPSAIVTYDPNTNLWSSLSTTGSGPGARTDQCMAISDDGSKLVVMGGRNADNFYQNYLAELFVLDLNSLVWTRAKDYSSPRLNAVCTIYNDTFISWGGGDSSATVSAPAILYDLKRNKYLSVYMGPDPDNDYDSTMGPQKNPSPTSDGGGLGGTGGSYGGSDDSGGSNVPQIVGGVVGGVAALFVILMVFRGCRRRGYNAGHQQQVVLDVYKDGQLVNQGHNGTRHTGEVTFVGQAATQQLSTMQISSTGVVSPRPISHMNVVQPISPQFNSLQQYSLLNPQPSNQQWHHLPSQSSFSDVRPTTLEQGSPQRSSSQAYPPLPPLPQQPQQLQGSQYPQSPQQLQHAQHSQNPHAYDAPPSYADSPQLRSREPEYVPEVSVPVEHGDGTISSGSGSPMSWPLTLRSPELIPQ